MVRNSILTPRLIMRDITEADAELLLALDSAPEVTKYVGLKQTDLVTYQDRIRSTYLAWQTHPWHGIRLVCERQSNNFLGWVFMRSAVEHMFANELGWTKPSELEIGYRFKQDTWGKGIATESSIPLIELAMNDPGCPAVVGCADHRNLASIKVMQSLGWNSSAKSSLKNTQHPSSR